MFQSNLRPGEGFKKIAVWKSDSGLTSYGRHSPGDYLPTEDYIWGIVTNANQKEIDQWKQNGHPISHKVTEYGAQIKAEATDLLVTEDDMRLYIQGIKNPGGLGITIIYFVTERFDMKREING